MKFLASSSYDYMKLMVMELQQKLAEVEELEKAQIQQDLLLQKSNQQRPNPFNKATDTMKIANSAAAAASSSWAQIHAKIGAKIASDRDKWCLSLLN